MFPVSFDVRFLSHLTYPVCLIRRIAPSPPPALSLSQLTYRLDDSGMLPQPRGFVRVRIVATASILAFPVSFHVSPGPQRSPSLNLINVNLFTLRTTVEPDNTFRNPPAILLAGKHDCRMAIGTAV